MLECVADTASRADDTEIDGAAVRGQVVTHEWVHGRAHGTRHHRAHRLAGFHALSDARTACPPRCTQKRYVDLGWLARAFATKKRRPVPRESTHGRLRFASRTLYRRSLRCPAPAPCPRRRCRARR